MHYPYYQRSKGYGQMAYLSPIEHKQRVELSCAQQGVCLAVTAAQRSQLRQRLVYVGKFLQEHLQV